MTLDDQLDELVTSFNRRLLDIPDGLLDRNATFSLNGVPYETFLGRDTDDPLARLIARGPAGYRFVAQAVFYALPQTRVAFELDGATLAATLSLTGTLRGSGERFETSLAVRLTTGPAGAVVAADVSAEEAALAQLRFARSTT
jgi:hypothetical protein